MKVAAPCVAALLALTAPALHAQASSPGGVAVARPAIEQLARTGEVLCRPTLPYFCSNLHVACSGQTSMKTFPFKLRANRSHGTIEPAPEAESPPMPYDNARVEWDGEGQYVVLHPRGASGYIKLLADGTYSFRHYSQDIAVMSVGRCN